MAQRWIRQPGTRGSALRVGVIGASGYSGAELLRWLTTHPRATITVATAGRAAGRAVGEIYPQLASLGGLRFSPLNIQRVVDQADLFFVALPAGESARVIVPLLKRGRRVIDVGADFRLRDARLYPRWYGWRHPQPRWLAKAVYGLPEFHAAKIAAAQLVANPGCYPTAALLGLAPLASRAYLRTDVPIIIDAKSGLSGAGRGDHPEFQLPEALESLEAYKIGTHRHTPEIEQELAKLSGRRMPVVFTPHLVPMSRGLLATLYLPLRRPLTTAQLQKRYRTVYARAHFVRVRDDDGANPRHVRGTNFCEISVAAVGRAGQAVITCAIDNLGKGAAGQAVQNLNLMMGWPESLGLDAPGLIA